MTHGRQLTILLKTSKIMFYPQRQKIMKRQISKRKKKMATTTPTPTPTPTPTTTAMAAPNWLPDEIIFFHILPKLPVRCLLRFTCVSKLWYTTIHHPNFIASHFSHAKSNPSLVAICVEYRSHYLNFLHLEKKEEEEKGGEHHYPIYNNNSNNASVDLLLAPLIVIGSCNGLTCSVLPANSIQITNPSTRELLVIRRPKKSKAAQTICRGGSSNGFGFDPLMNEYKFIQNYVDCSGYYECWVYTLGSNLWRNITTTCNNYLSSFFPLMAPICTSGAIFWRTSEFRGILSFDLHHEKFQFIPSPQVPPGSSICYTLFEMEGRPCLVYRDDNLIKDGVQLTLYTLKDHHHLNGMHTKQQQQQQQQQHKASSCSGSWIRLGDAIHIPKKPDTESIRVVAFYKQIYLQWVTMDGDFMLCNVNRLGIQNKYCSATYGYLYVLHVNHVENLLSLKTFVPPSADEDEVRYVSSREAIHESLTTSTSSCSGDRQRRELLRERKRYRLLTHGCLTIPCWVSR